MLNQSPCSILIRKVFLVSILFFGLTGHARADTLITLIRTQGLDKVTELERWCNKTLYYKSPRYKTSQLDRLESLSLKHNDEVSRASAIFYRGLYVYAKDGGQHSKGVAEMNRAIELADVNGQEMQSAYFRHSLGYYYFTSRKEYVPALENILRAHYVFHNAGYESVFDHAGILDRTAWVYYHLSNYNESIKYLKLSLNYSMDTRRRHISILNTVGQSYRELFEADSASKYFRMARHQAKLARDTAWIGITSGNVAHLHLTKSEYFTAEPLMKEYYRCAIMTKDTALVVEAMTGLAEISRAMGRVGEALSTLKKAEDLLAEAFRNADMPPETFLRRQYLYSIYSKTWESKGDAAKSLWYLKEATQIKDSIERRAKLSKNFSIQQMFEAEQANNRLKIMQQQKQSAVMKQYFMYAIGLLLLVVFGLLLSRQHREKKIHKQKRELLLVQKQQIEDELRFAKEQLHEYLRNIRQQSELLHKAEVEMDGLRKQHQIPVEDERQVLQKLNYATILTEDDWTRFKILFEKVHSGFFAKLKTTYPDLTPAEIRLGSLIKLGLSSHEMASMTGISTMGIKKTRQRLRKKINLPESEKLEDVFMNL